jgi:hypothetical protein
MFKLAQAVEKLMRSNTDVSTGDLVNTPARPVQIACQGGVFLACVYEMHNKILPPVFPIKLLHVNFQLSVPSKSWVEQSQGISWFTGDIHAPSFHFQR